MTKTNLLKNANESQDPVIKALLKKIEEGSEAYLRLYHESRKKTIQIETLKRKLEKLQDVLTEAGPTLAYKDVRLAFHLRRWQPPLQSLPWEVEKPHEEEEEEMEEEEEVEKEEEEVEEEEEVDDEATVSE